MSGRSYHLKKPWTHELSHSPLSGPLATMVCVDSMGLPVLDISYKWNHIICGLLQLTSFTEDSVLWFIHAEVCVSSSFLFMAE